MLLYNSIITCQEHCHETRNPPRLPPSAVPRYRGGCVFLIGSTADTDRTHTHSDGVTYPYLALDVSSASHPVYTGQQRKTQAEGRIAGFNKRFAGFGAKAQ